MEQVIINTDIGGDFDDLLALVLALYSPEIEIQGIVTTKEHIRDKALFARKILDLAGRSDVPVFYFGEQKPSAPGSYISVHDYGLITIEDTKKSDDESRISANAIEFIVQTITNHPNEITIVSLAPNTPYAAAIDAEPLIAQKVKQAYLMGGALDTEENRHAPPEHNYRKDRHAFQVLVDSGIPINIIPRDITYQFLDPSVLAQKAPMDALHQTVWELAQRFLTYMNRTSFRVADPITMGAVIFPELYDSHPAKMNTEKKRRGLVQTLPEETDSKIRVYTKIDTERFYARLCERV